MRITVSKKGKDKASSSSPPASKRQKGVLKEPNLKWYKFPNRSGRGRTSCVI
ncbi:hypothetical protein HanPSC8_Chr13g0591951 [Helianthus annuus]|nr:hypothetical protein HanPSC8_Chr13g0591951 [Helianthus annuus]